MLTIKTNKLLFFVKLYDRNIFTLFNFKVCTWVLCKNVVYLMEYKGLTLFAYNLSFSHKTDANFKFILIGCVVLSLPVTKTL